MTLPPLRDLPVGAATQAVRQMFPVEPLPDGAPLIYTAEMEPHTLQWAHEQYESGDPVRRPGKQWISHNNGWAAVFSYMSAEDREATDWESYSEVASKDPRSAVT